MKVVVVSGSRSPRRETLDVPETATVAELRRLYKPKLSDDRKSFRLPADGANSSSAAEAAVSAAGSGGKAAVNLDAPTSANKPLTAFGIREGSEVLFKDLGPQVGYRTVFVVEYAGPIAIMALYALLPNAFFAAASLATATPSAHTKDVQRLFFWLFILHFVKRELETFFVHKFSRPTMPLRNIFKNCAYYWSFAAVIGYFLNRPEYVAPAQDGFVLANPTVAAAAMVLNELGNLAVHLQLSSMRREEGDSSRNVPKGPLFALVSCPNYTFEILSWVAFSVGTGLWSSWVFTAVGLAQMTQWALKKHKDYIKADASNRSKKAIIPFVI